MPSSSLNRYQKVKLPSTVLWQACSVCRCVKPRSMFYVYDDYVMPRCRACSVIQRREWNKANRPRERVRARFEMYKRKHRVPPWHRHEMDKIQLVYDKATELSKAWGVDLHVDHVLPLQGKTVSGLHTWMNLQILEASINISKGNRL